MLNLNERAFKIVNDIINRKEELNVKLFELKNGTKVLDFNNATIEAGILYSLITLGGLARINISYKNFFGINCLVLEEYVNNPVIACLASQKAGWNIKVDDFQALGSGPARILAKKPKKTFEKINYEEKSNIAIICLETNKLPDEKVSEYISKSCNINPDDLYILVTRTNSLVGIIQVMARIVEMALFKMELLDMDLSSIISAYGIVPIPLRFNDEIEAMCNCNDALIYGGIVYLFSNENIDGSNIPSSSSDLYGMRFKEIYERAGHDFYKIDARIFSPAVVYINGKKYGEVNIEILKQII